MPRFLGPADRVIDDGRRGGQNAATISNDTIVTIGADWLAEVMGAAAREVNLVWGDGAAISPAPLLACLPDWFNILIDLKDLPSAYKGTPILPEHIRAANLEVWDAVTFRWLFPEIWSLISVS